MAREITLTLSVNVRKGKLRYPFNPGSVARHLGQGRFVSVLKAAILGIPIPL